MLSPRTDVTACANRRVRRFAKHFQRGEEMAKMATLEIGTATCCHTMSAPDPSTRNERAKRAPAIVNGRRYAARKAP